jgi:hypothetical protein
MAKFNPDLRRFFGSQTHTITSGRAWCWRYQVGQAAEPNAIAVLSLVCSMRGCSSCGPDSPSLMRFSSSRASPYALLRQRFISIRNMCSDDVSHEARRAAESLTAFDHVYLKMGAKYKLPGFRTNLSIGATTCSTSEQAGHRQWRHQFALVSLRPKLRRQFVGDMPGEDDGAFRLVLKHAALLDHRDQRARHAFSDFQ